MAARLSEKISHFQPFQPFSRLLKAQLSRLLNPGLKKYCESSDNRNRKSSYLTRLAPVLSQVDKMPKQIPAGHVAKLNLLFKVHLVFA